MKAKNINKVVSIFLCLAMLITPMMSFASGSSAVDSVGSAIEDINAVDPTGKDTTQAQKSEYDEHSNSGDNTVNVYATKGSVFTIKIPKTVILDGQSKSGQYQVAVSGDFAGQEIISVIPDASFTLRQAGKDDVTATISQDKTEWSYDETNVKATGTVTASNVSAGMWNGNFKFNIGVGTSGQTFNVTIWKEFTGEGGDNGVTTETLTFTASKELMPIEGEYGACEFSNQGKPCVGHYEITKPSFAFISLMCASWEQAVGGAIPIPFSINYEICLNKWLDSGMPIMTKVGGDIENATLTITQEDIDNAGGVYYLHINARGAMYPSQPIEQNVHLVYGVYEL